MADSIFTKIINREIQADIIYEDEEMLAFRDINPQAEHHFLIIPKKQIETINDLGDNDALLAGRMILKARDLAREYGFDKSGYRLVFNCNKHGGQEVYHIHLHVLGGRQMKWPPG